MASRLVGVSWLANQSPDYLFPNQAKPNQTKPPTNNCRWLQLHIAGFQSQVASCCWRRRRSGGKLNCRNYFMSNARFGKQFVTFEWPFNDNCGCLLAKSSAHSLFLRSVIDSPVSASASLTRFYLGLGFGWVGSPGRGSVGNEISAIKLRVSSGVIMCEKASDTVGHQVIAECTP